MMTGSGRLDDPLRAVESRGRAVTLIARFPAGSVHDPPGKEGLAHLTGRLLVAASSRRRSYRERLAALFPLAGRIELRVDKESATLEGRAHPETLRAFLDLWCETLTEPAFREEDFARLRDESLTGLQRTLRFSSDEELARAQLDAMAFAACAYRHPLIGTVRGLRALALDDAERFWREHYTRSALVLGLAGDPDAHASGELRERLAGLPGGAPPEAPPVRAESAKRRISFSLIQKAGADASISAGAPLGVLRGDEDFFPLLTATSWLGEHRSSAGRLFQAIRERRGLNYGDYAYIEAFPGAGARQVPPTGEARRAQLFEIWIRTLPNEAALFALRLALREHQRLAEDGLDEESIALQARFLRRYSTHFAPTSAERLGYALDDLFYGLEPGSHLARFESELGAMSAERVNAALRRHFAPAGFHVAIVSGRCEALRDTLLSGAATPVSYDTPKPRSVTDEDAEIASWPLAVPEADVTIRSVEEVFES